MQKQNYVKAKEMRDAAKEKLSELFTYVGLAKNDLTRLKKEDELDLIIQSEILLLILRDGRFSSEEISFLDEISARENVLFILGDGTDSMLCDAINGDRDKETIVYTRLRTLLYSLLESFISSFMSIDRMLLYDMLGELAFYIAAIATNLSHSRHDEISNEISDMDISEGSHSLFSLFTELFEQLFSNDAVN
ncbi:MAG: hypothetical protein IJW48_00980 [Clostridia bacterium]|nr:hypothetical protein [Clostridia bacterium]